MGSSCYPCHKDTTFLQVEPSTLTYVKVTQTHLDTPFIRCRQYYASVAGLRSQTFKEVIVFVDEALSLKLGSAALQLSEFDFNTFRKEIEATLEKRNLILKPTQELCQDIKPKPLLVPQSSAIPAVSIDPLGYNFKKKKNNYDLPYFEHPTQSKPQPTQAVKVPNVTKLFQKNVEQWIVACIPIWDNKADSLKYLKSAIKAALLMISNTESLAIVEPSELLGYDRTEFHTQLLKCTLDWDPSEGQLHNINDVTYLAHNEDGASLFLQNVADQVFTIHKKSKRRNLGQRRQIIKLHHNESPKAENQEVGLSGSNKPNGLNINVGNIIPNSALGEDSSRMMPPPSVDIIHNSSQLTYQNLSNVSLNSLRLSTLPGSQMSNYY